MKITALTAFLFCAAFAANRARALPVYTVDEVIYNMEKAERNLQTVKFRFEQDVDFADVKKDIHVKGEAIFSKPKKFHIEKTGPAQQITVSDGQTLWTYSPAHNQVWQSKVKDGGFGPLFPKGLAPVNDLVGELKKNFKLALSTTIETAEGPEIWLEATPKEAPQEYTLKLNVSPDSWFPTKLVYHSDSARVVTKLINVEFNPALPKNVFRFVPPKGVDVIPLQ